VCGIGLCPLKTDFPGPAPKMTNAEEEDIIDETISYFRAQINFKNF
jgi:hypothetical protein